MFTKKTSLNISVLTVAIFLSFFFIACRCPSYSLLFSPSPRYNITHSNICHFSMVKAHSFFFLFFFKSYLQFYPSKKALVIKTHAFTIIINLSSFFHEPKLLIDSRENFLKKFPILSFTII